MQRPLRHLLAVLGAAVLSVACSTTTEIGSGAPAPSGGSVPATDQGPGVPMSAEACALSHDSLEVAADAYMAINGVYPETLQQMVDANLLMTAVNPAWVYSYTPGSRDYVITAVAGGPCD